MFGETAALSGLQKIKPCKFTCSEEQDDGTVFKITIEISPIACEVDLSEMPPQLSNSMNSTKEASEIAAQVIFKAVTTPTLPGNCGNFNPLKVTTKQGTVLIYLYSITYLYSCATLNFPRPWECTTSR